MSGDAPQTHHASIPGAPTAEGAQEAATPPYDARAVLRAHWMFNATPPEDGVKGAPPEYQCIECLGAWLGDPENGGCDAARGAREVLRLRAALEAMAECTATEVSYRRVLLGHGAIHSVAVETAEMIRQNVLLTIHEHAGIDLGVEWYDPAPAGREGG